jgi:hypothetical protein
MYKAVPLDFPDWLDCIRILISDREYDIDDVFPELFLRNAYFLEQTPIEVVNMIGDTKFSINLLPI